MDNFPLINGDWLLSDLKKPEEGAPTVFSCFHCGGGSTMGYKLAGFKVLGGVEIDPKMMSIYRENQKPELSFLMEIQEFNKIPNESLDPRLFSLDILDGSPPCSSFSMSGSREKAWGKNKKFREGQAEQVLDELFFSFIETAKKLKPKVVVAENVKGLLMGNAKGYVQEIFSKFSEAGYETQLFLLNASRMGVPQSRERVFFIARRSELNLEKIKLEFNEQIVPFKTIDDGDTGVSDLTETFKKYWLRCNPGENFSSAHHKGSFFNSNKVHPEKPLRTLVSGNAEITFHWKFIRKLTTREWVRGQTFPLDYNFLNIKEKYVIGMSVPPLMMQRLSYQIKKQILKIA